MKWLKILREMIFGPTLKDQFHEIMAAEESTTVAGGKPKRAKTAKGQFKADDKSTGAVNEAWVDGEAPVRRRRPKKYK